MRLLLLETMAQATLEKLPASWIVELGRTLEHADERVLRQAVATLRAHAGTDFDEVLERLGKDSRRVPEVRVAALLAAAPRLRGIDRSVFDYLRSLLDQKLPPLLRRAAADALRSLRLDDAQLEILADTIRSASAMELPLMVSAFERSRNPTAGYKLIAALGKAPGLQSLSADGLRRTLKEYPAEVQKAAAPLFKQLEADTAKQKVRLADFEPVLTGGNAKRGHTVFFGARAACAICHTAGTEGGKVGPELSKIGSIRTGRDLLEAVLLPSASFVRGYEPYVVTTKEGRVFDGILGRDTTDVLCLVTAERSEIRIPRSALEEIQPGRVSLMPPGLEAQLNRQELSDLIAFLASLK